MHRYRLLAGLFAGLLAALAASHSQAFFHAWVFSEFFSNADGSVQFVEMFSSLSTETQATGAEIRTDSGNVFSFPGNLSGNTFNKRLLIATPGFASLPGAVTPDFTLPTTDFFDPGGDRIRLFHPSLGEFHTRTFESVPTDGVMSVNYPPTSGTVLTNSPTNFAGASGSVDLSAPGPTGDYNGNGIVDAGDYVVWRATLDEPAVPAGSGADGDESGTIDAGDYDFWAARFGDTVAGAGAGAAIGAVPEPATVVLFLPALLAMTCMVRRRPG